MEKYGPLSLPEVPLEIVQGETFILPITYTDESGNLVDFTGFTGRMQIRDTISAANPPLVDLTTENGCITIYGTTGYLEIFIPNNVTAALPADFQGVYDIFVYGTTGIAIRLLRGPVLISGGVTR